MNIDSTITKSCDKNIDCIITKLGDMGDIGRKTEIMSSSKLNE